MNRSSRQPSPWFASCWQPSPHRHPAPGGGLLSEYRQEFAIVVAVDRQTVPSAPAPAVHLFFLLWLEGTVVLFPALGCVGRSAGPDSTQSREKKRILVSITLCCPLRKPFWELETCWPTTSPFQTVSVLPRGRPQRTGRESLWCPSYRLALLCIFHLTDRRTHAIINL